MLRHFLIFDDIRIIFHFFLNTKSTARPLVDTNAIKLAGKVQRINACLRMKKAFCLAQTFRNENSWQCQAMISKTGGRLQEFKRN